MILSKMDNNFNIHSIVFSENVNYTFRAELLVLAIKSGYYYKFSKQKNNVLSSHKDKYIEPSIVGTDCLSTFPIILDTMLEFHNEITTFLELLYNYMLCYF